MNSYKKKLVMLAKKNVVSFFNFTSEAKHPEKKDGIEM